jgi:predicted AAA+ superfamily ATPase
MDLIKKSKKSINNNLFSRKYYLEKLKNFVSTQNMLAIIGQRRVGKSFVVLDYLKTEKINLDNVFYINKEFDIDNELKNVSDLAKSFDNYEKNFKVDFIIIDEIQDIENWEKFVRAKIAEKKYKIIITGSNSKLLSGELATYFA